MWTATLAAGKAVWAFLRALPWQVWLVLAVAGAFWGWGDMRYDAGVAEENARWVAAEEEADAKAKADEEKRDAEAADVAAETTEAAHDAVVETRTETASATERVRVITRTIEVPVGCPATLPESVNQEGREAVRRARAAGRTDSR